MIQYLTTIVLTLFTASQTLAQVPNSPGNPPEDNSAVLFLIIFVVVVLLGYATFRSSKRTHQD